MAQSLQDIVNATKPVKTLADITKPAATDIIPQTTTDKSKLQTSEDVNNPFFTPFNPKVSPDYVPDTTISAPEKSLLPKSLTDITDKISSGINEWVYNFVQWLWTVEKWVQQVEKWDTATGYWTQIVGAINTFSAPLAGALWELSRAWKAWEDITSIVNKPFEISKDLFSTALSKTWISKENVDNYSTIGATILLAALWAKAWSKWGVVDSTDIAPAFSEAIGKINSIKDVPGWRDAAIKIGGSEKNAAYFSDLMKQTTKEWVAKVLKDFDQSQTKVFKNTKKNIPAQKPVEIIKQPVTWSKLADMVKTSKKPTTTVPTTGTTKLADIVKSATPTKPAPITNQVLPKVVEAYRKTASDVPVVQKNISILESNLGKAPKEEWVFKVAVTPDRLGQLALWDLKPTVEWGLQGNAVYGRKSTDVDYGDPKQLSYNVYFKWTPKSNLAGDFAFDKISPEDIVWVEQRNIAPETTQSTTAITQATPTEVSAPEIGTVPTTEWPQWIPPELQRNETIRYNPGDFSGIKARLNIVQHAIKKTVGKVTGWVIGKAYDNIGKFLNNVVLNVNGKRVWLGDFVSWFDQDKKALYDSIKSEGWVDSIDNIDARNVPAINKWYKYLNKNIDTYIPGSGTVVDMLRDNIKLSKIDNTLDKRIVGEKQIHTSQATALNNAVGLKSEMQMRAQWGPDFMSTLSDEQKKTITDNVISEFPIETQEYLHEIWDKNSPFIHGSIIRNAFDKFGSEMEWTWLLRGTKDNYIHGYNNRDLYQKWVDRLPNEDAKLLKSLWIDEWYNIFDKLKDIADPEQRSKILKSTKNVWFLQSRDPRTIMRSYASEVSRLIKEKQVKDLVESITKNNKEVGAYLGKTLLDENSRVYKILRDVPIGKNALWKATDTALRAVSFGQLVGNIPGAVQNITTTAGRFAGQMIGQLVRGEASFKNLPRWSYSDTFDYLHNTGLISNKVIDNIDNTFKWTGSAIDKIKAGSKAWLSHAYELFTSIGEANAQTISAMSYMNSVIKNLWWGIKEWETITQAYKRTLKDLPTNDRLIIESWLSEWVRNIGDWTKFSKGTTGIFDNTIFNQFKTWSRDTFSKVRTNTENIVDRVWERLKWNNKAFEWISKDIIPLLTNTIGIYVAVRTLVEGVNQLSKNKMSQDEIDAYMKRLYTDSVGTWIKNNLSFPISASGITGIVDSLWAIATLYTRVRTWRASEKSIETELLHHFWGLERALRDTMPYFDSEKFPWLVKTAWGNFKYQNKTYSNVLGALLGISKEKAWYDKSTEEIQKIEDEYLKSDKNYDPVISSLVNSFTLNSNSVNNFFSNLQNLDMIDGIDKINSNIKSGSKMKMTPEQWVDNAFSWVEFADQNQPGWVFEQFKKWLWKSTTSQWTRNYQVVASISKLIDGIKSFKSVTFYPDDFNRTIQEFKDKQPEQYSEFLSNVYSFTAKPGWDDAAQAVRKVFIDSKIADEMGGARLGGALADKIRQVIKEWGTAKTIKTWLANTDADNLQMLNDLVWIVKKRPELYSQVFDSFTQLINTNLTPENAKQIKNAIDTYPEIRALYERWAELRWAVLKDKPSIVSDSVKPSLQSIVPTRSQQPTKTFTELPSISWATTTPSKTKLTDLIQQTKQQKQQPLFWSLAKQPAKKWLTLAEIIAQAQKSR